MYLLERKEATYENLRDLNFEYKAGKLSEQDYAVQRAALEDEAATPQGGTGRHSRLGSDPEGGGESPTRLTHAIH